VEGRGRKKFFEANVIFQGTTESGDHNLLGIIDAFSKTLKNIIFKYGNYFGTIIEFSSF
jgi:hypothetical protein